MSNVITRKRDKEDDTSTFNGSDERNFTSERAAGGSSPPRSSVERAKPDYSLRPSICKIPVKNQKRLALSLSGCGFLCTYHFGVLRCFLMNGRPFLNRLDRLTGASAGSLAATLMLLMPDKLESAYIRVLELADEMNTLSFGALSPGFFLAERLTRIIDEFLPSDVSAANGKLYVSVTNNKTRGNVLLNEFADRASLIESLNASCYIPMYSMGVTANPPIINGETFVDGGYSNNLPDFADIRTITVSPFASIADITPNDPGFDWKMILSSQHMKVNLRNIVRGAQALFPPSRPTLQHYHDEGYTDAFKFLFDNDLLERPQGTAV